MTDDVSIEELQKALERMDGVPSRSSKRSR
jgi:hypothetical protein